MPYAIDDERVFEHDAWVQLWGPYKNVADAARAPVGTEVGQRFPDLALRTKDSNKKTLAGFRGQVVLLHFWGSWCPPCCRELPKIERLKKQLEQAGVAVEMVMVPVRERAVVSRRWLREQSIDLPVYDAGASDEEDGEYLSLGNGEKLHDRSVARQFPATFVLDRHGIVLFSRVGPIDNWDEYIGFFTDAATRSGK